MIRKNKLIAGTTLLVVICLIASSVFVYFEFFGCGYRPVPSNRHGMGCDPR